MKTNILIIIVGLSVVAIFGGLYAANVIQNMENQKLQEEWRELRASVMNDLGKQKKCEEIGGSWNTDHCLITQETFDSNKLTCDPGPVLEDSTCQSNGIKLVFESVVESKTTGVKFYPRIHISILPDTESTQYVDPDFVTIGPGSQVTWSNYDDVPVSINSVDPDDAWSTTVIPPDGYDTVTFEETGIYEYKGNEGIHGFIIVMDDDDPTRHVRGVYFSDWYDLDELYGLGCDQPILSHLSIYSNLLDEEFDGKYSMKDVGLADGVFTEKFNECVDFIFEKRTSSDFDKTWGGPGNRHPAFLGWDIPDVCTSDMVKFLKKHSNIFDNDIPYMSPLDGNVLDPSINPDDMVQCENEILENRDNEPSWPEYEN